MKNMTGLYNILFRTRYAVATQKKPFLSRPNFPGRKLSVKGLSVTLIWLRL